MNACSCACIDPAGDGVHAIAVALADGDVDRALALGLLDVDACPGSSAACVAMVEAARDARRAALSARDRFRARNLRLERRAAERAARRAAPVPDPPDIATPPLPAAAADALARALAKAGLKR